MWERIEQVVPRHEPTAAIAALFELTPPLDSDADEAWRTQLVTRFGTVRPFLKLLVTVVDYGATQEGLPVLAAMKSLSDLTGRKKVGPAEVDTGLLTGSWRRLSRSPSWPSSRTIVGRRWIPHTARKPGSRSFRAGETAPERAHAREQRGVPRQPWTLRRKASGHATTSLRRKEGFLQRTVSTGIDTAPRRPGGAVAGTSAPQLAGELLRPLHPLVVRTAGHARGVRAGLALWASDLLRMPGPRRRALGLLRFPLSPARPRRPGFGRGRQRGLVLAFVAGALRVRCSREATAPAHADENVAAPGGPYELLDAPAVRMVGIGGASEDVELDGAAHGDLGGVRSERRAGLGPSGRPSAWPSGATRGGGDRRPRSRRRRR